MFNPGTYAVTFTQQHLGENANTSNAQVIIQFLPYAFRNQGVPDDSPQAWTELPQSERVERTSFLVLTSKSIPTAMTKLESIGVKDLESWGQLDQDDPGCKSIIGQAGLMLCKHDTYQGQTKEKWEIPFGGLEIKPLEAEGVRKLDALFGSYLKKPAAKVPTTKVPTSTPKAQKTAATTAPATPTPPPPAPAFPPPSATAEPGDDDLPY